MADIKAIRERLEKATAGPWEQTQGIVWIAIQVGELNGLEWEQEKIAESGIDDADFIAHARQDIPDLLELLDKYGGHKRNCVHWRRKYGKGECDCGYDEAMKGLGASAREGD